jgi:hypothetical protein
MCRDHPTIRIGSVGYVSTGPAVNWSGGQLVRRSTGPVKGKRSTGPVVGKRSTGPVGKKRSTGPVELVRRARSGLKTDQFKIIFAEI